MTEPTLFGIGKAQWEMINSFANWLAALGSIAAAAVALYLANRAARPTARVYVATYVIIEEGARRPFPEYVRFSIVNTGDRPIRVVQIGWKVGLFKKRYAVQNYEPSQSSRLPIDLTHGQEASWMVPFNATGREPWPQYFSKKILTPHYRTSLWTLRAQFHTSVGFTFQTKIAGNLRTPLLAACMGKPIVSEGEGDTV